MSTPDVLIQDEGSFRAAVRRTLASTKFDDVHVHVMPLCMGPEFALFGLPNAGAYHYLSGEAGAKGRRSRGEQQVHNGLSAEKQAEANLDTILGSGALPLSTASAGWFQMAKALGINPAQSHRDILREWQSLYGAMAPEEYHDMVLDLSPVRSMVSTQSIFLPKEARLYLDDAVLEKWDPRYEAAIRFDEALRKPDLLAESAKLANIDLSTQEYNSANAIEAMKNLTRRHLERFLKRTRVRYLSLSLSPDDRFYDTVGRESTSRFATVMRKVVVPLAKEFKLPIFMMPYVTRAVNPAAGASGDCVAEGNMDDIVRFVSENPDVGFILTSLHPSMDYNGCFLTRCCPNLRLIGFWWGNLNSNEVRRQIQQRFEFIGTAWYGLNSDARILDQLLYKWTDFFEDLEHVLATVFFPKLQRIGVPITQSSIRQTILEIQDTEKLLWTPPLAA